MRIARKLILAVSITALLAVVGAPLHAQATGTTDVDIIVDPLLILYYYSELDITLSCQPFLSDMLTDATVTAGTTDRMAWSHYQADEGTVAVTAAAGTDLDATCGDRPRQPRPQASTLNGGRPQHHQCLGRSRPRLDHFVDLRHRGPARRRCSRSSERYFDRTYQQRHDPHHRHRTPQQQVVVLSTRRQQPVTNTAPGLATADTGDVQLTLDFSNADTGGTYSSAAGTDFTITATHN